MISSNIYNFKSILQNKETEASSFAAFIQIKKENNVNIMIKLDINNIHQKNCVFVS